MAQFLAGSKAKEWKELACVKRWQERLAPTSFRTYYPYTVGFCKHATRDPDGLIAWGKTAENKYDVLDQIQQFILTLNGQRYATKRTAYAAVQSFFVHNRVMLPRDPSFKIRSDSAPVERRLTIENLHELIGLSTQPMRSMLLVKWQGILDTESLIQISETQGEVIVNAIHENGKLLRLSLPGRKKARNLRPFYTFIGQDALESLKDYFERTRGYPRTGEPVWVWQGKATHITKEAFGMAWLRLLRKAKLIPKTQGSPTARYGYNVHNTRDLAISLLNTVPRLNPKCIEFWAGHDIDPLGYNQFYQTQPAYVVEQYKLAEPYLNILSGPQQAEAQEVKTLREELEQLKLAVRTLQDASGLKVVSSARQ